MNTLEFKHLKRATALKLAAAGLILAVLFPPWVEITTYGGGMSREVNRGYHFLLLPPDLQGYPSRVRPDFARLSLEICAIAIIASVAHFALAPAGLAGFALSPPAHSPAGFVWIPPGRFMMGSPAGERERSDDEGPQTVVTLTRGFFLEQHVVTQGEYQAVTGGNPSQFTGDLNRPVEQVSWDDAVAYCVRLTAQERAAGRLPAGWAYRLPTEAEWEYAARAGTTTRFPWGDDPDYTQIGNYAWFGWPGGNGGDQTLPVGKKQANPWGLYDMAGNVAEWCADWYGGYSGGSVADPTGPGTGSYRVFRGGGWYYGGQDCRSAARDWVVPGYRSYGIGFRVGLVAVP